MPPRRGPHALRAAHGRGCVRRGCLRVHRGSPRVQRRRRRVCLQVLQRAPGRGAAPAGELCEGRRGVHLLGATRGGDRPLFEEAQGAQL